VSRDKPASERMPLCPVCKNRHSGVLHVWTKSGALVPQKPKKGKKP
jgi:hypothetical protein